MATIRGPRIVNNGLILCLDAADRKSYPGSGTAWTDLSGNLNNGTLTNGPTFSSINGGAIVFDGSNDYSSATVNLSSYSQITVEIWIKPNNAVETIAFEHSANWNSNTSGFGLAINSSGGGTNSTLCHCQHTYTGVNSRNYAFTCGTTNYSCHVHIFSNIVDSTGRLVYVNGNLLPFSSTGGYSTSTATVAGSAFRNDTMYLASRGGGSFFMNGNIAIFKIYNRKLSASEILQNFNAQRGRFGI